MAEERRKVELKVEDADRNDLAKGVARIDQASMEQLQVSIDDTVEIAGKRKTAATVYQAPPPDEGRSIIRIDAYIRRNAGTSVGGLVEVCRAEVHDAMAVVLAPIGMRLNVDDDFELFLKNKLFDRPVNRRDAIQVIMLGQPIQFMVVNTKPRGIVKILGNTDLKVLGDPLNLAEVELASVDKLEDLQANVELLETRYVGPDKDMELKIGVSVEFLETVWTCEFSAGLKEPDNLSSQLEGYRCEVLEELKEIKADIKKRIKQTGLPITLDLSALTNIVVQKLTEKGKQS
jgi:transitional endoplasmic reticulum ATPase